MKRKRQFKVSPIPVSAIILITALILTSVIAAAICCKSADPSSAAKLAAKICIAVSAIASGITLKISGANKRELLIFSSAITLLLLAAECTEGITVVGIIMICASFAAVNFGYFIMCIGRGKRKRKRR